MKRANYTGEKALKRSSLLRKRILFYKDLKKFFITLRFLSLSSIRFNMYRKMAVVLEKKLKNAIGASCLKVQDMRHPTRHGSKKVKKNGILKSSAKCSAAHFKLSRL